MRKLKFKKRRITYIFALWRVKCGWCGQTHAVATDGRNRFCSGCGF